MSERRPLKKYIKKIKQKFIKKYEIPKNFYIKKKINDLIFNTKSHYTSIFKDFLIEGEEHDFLRKYYVENETKKKLKKIYHYYEKYSKIYPNYLPLSESKYMYKNILKKQNMIHKLHEIKKKEEENKNEKNNEEIIFNYEVMKNICEQIDSFYTKNLKNVIDISNSKNNTVEDFNKIINEIDKEEILNLKYDFNDKSRPYKNLINQNKVKNDFSNSSSSLNKFDISSKSYRSSNYSNLNKRNIELLKYPNKNKLSSTFYPNIHYNNNLSHKKFCSQDVKSEDHIKKLFLIYDNNGNEITKELNLYSVRLNYLKKNKNNIKTPFYANSTRDDKNISKTYKELPKVSPAKDIIISSVRKSKLIEFKDNIKDKYNKNLPITPKINKYINKNIKFKLTSRSRNCNLKK